MPKDKSDAQSVFDMINSLRSQFGSPEAEPQKEPDEDPEKVEILEEDRSESVSADAASLPEEAAEKALEDAPLETPAAVDEAEEPLPEDILTDNPDPALFEPSQSFSKAVDEAPKSDEKEAQEVAPEEPIPQVFPEGEMPEEIHENPVDETAEERAEEALDNALEASTEEVGEEASDESLEHLPETEAAEASDEEPDSDEGLENQIALEMPEAVPAPDAPVKEAPAPEAAPAPKAVAPEPEPAPAEEVPAKERLARKIVTTVGKPIASEQIAMDRLPMMRSDPSRALPEDQPSVESLERSSPDLSALTDDARLSRSGLSEEDIRMMLEFGYEDDLRRVLGNRTVRKIKYPGDALERTPQSIRPYAYPGKEYDGSPESREKILAGYKREKPFLIWRLIVIAFCALALLFLDVWAERIVSWPYPILPSLFEIAFLLLAAAFSHRALTGGYKSLIYFAPTPHSIPALFLPIALTVDLLSAFLPASPFPAVNFPVALLLLLSALGDAFRFSTEKRSFLVVSSADTGKIVIDPYVRRKKKLQSDNKILCIIDDSPEHAEYRVKPTERVTGFFRRQGNLSGSTRAFSLSLSLSFGIAAVGGLIARIFSSSAEGVWPTLSTFVSALFFAVPASAIFAFFYPARLVSGELARKRTALVGEESVFELEEPCTLLFDDHLAFSEKDCTGTSVRKDADTTQDLRLSGILFRKLGGVLTEIAAPLFPDGPDPAVSILRIREDGVEALVDNRYHMLAGSRDYLVRCGIRCPAEPKNKGWQSAGTAELFVAIDDVLKLQYKLDYSKKQEFELLLERLKGAGVDAGVFTYDPSLNEAFLSRLYGNEGAPAVVKPGAFDTEPLLSIADSPVVALGKESDLAEPIEAAALIRRARKVGFRIQWIASILGVTYVTVCSLLGKTSLLGLGALSIFHIAVLLLTWAAETAQFKKKQS